MEGYIQNVKSISTSNIILYYFCVTETISDIESKDFVVTTVGSTFFSFFRLLHIPREFVQFLWEKIYVQSSAQAFE